MKKTLMAIAAVATLAVSAMAPTSASAQHWRGHGGGGAVAAGLIGGALLGGAIAAGSGYYGPGYYGPGYGYYGRPAYVAGPGYYGERYDGPYVRYYGHDRGWHRGWYHHDRDYDRGVVVHHVGPPVPSAPHLHMTVAMLRAAGAGVDDTIPDVWSVEPGRLVGRGWNIEPDLSSAAPFLAAAMVTGGEVRVPDWPRTTTQRMLNSNLAMTEYIWPFISERPPVLVDWLDIRQSMDELEHASS